MSKKKLYQPHYSTTTDARVLQKRQALRQALMSLIDEKPLDQITIREIVAAAGIGYNTFFRHYPNKEALVQEMVTDELTDLIEYCFRAMDTTNSSGAALALCQFVADHDGLWSTLLNGGAANTLREEFIRLLQKTAPLRVSDKAVIPVDIGINLVASGTLELLSWWLQQSERISVKQLADIFEQLILNPVATAYLD